MEIEKGLGNVSSFFFFYKSFLCTLYGLSRGTGIIFRRGEANINTTPRKKVNVKRFIGLISTFPSPHFILLQLLCAVFTHSRTGTHNLKIQNYIAVLCWVASSHSVKVQSSLFCEVYICSLQDGATRPRWMCQYYSSLTI